MSMFTRPEKKWAVGTNEISTRLSFDTVDQRHAGVFCKTTRALGSGTRKVLGYPMLLFGRGVSLGLYAPDR